MTDGQSTVDHDLLAAQIEKAKAKGKAAAQPGVHVPIERGSPSHIAMVEVSLGRPLTTEEKREYKKPALPSAIKLAVNEGNYAKGDTIIDGWVKTSGR